MHPARKSKMILGFTNLIVVVVAYLGEVNFSVEVVAGCQKLLLNVYDTGILI